MDPLLEPKPLFTIPEAAFALGVSRSTVYELIDGGDLVRLKIGNRALVTASSMRQFIERLEREAAPTPADVPADQASQSGSPTDGPA